MLVVPSRGLAPELCESRKLAEHKRGYISFPLFLTVDVIYPASSTYLDFPAITGCDVEL